MKYVWITLLMSLLTKVALANIAIATFATSYKHNIQIAIDGKVINNQPKEAVKLRAPAGLHQLEIRIFDVCGEIMDIYEDVLTADAGISSDYVLYYRNHCDLVLRKQEASLIYVDKLRRPDKFYNQKMIAIIARPRLLPDLQRFWVDRAVS